MDNIIEDLLLLADARAGETKLSPLAMGSIVAQAQRRLDYLIEEYQAEITTPNAWPMALGHGLWIEQVWVSYLRNGIMYGGRPPRLKLGATRQPEGMVRFWARDNGSGLTLKDQDRLFTPYIQLSQVRPNGQGLGLYNVRRFVERLGGQVGVESELGCGTVYTFTLPEAKEHDI